MKNKIKNKCPHKRDIMIKIGNNLVCEKCFRKINKHISEYFNMILHKDCKVILKWRNEK